MPKSILARERESRSSTLRYSSWPGFIPAIHVFTCNDLKTYARDICAKTCVELQRHDDSTQPPLTHPKFCSAGNVSSNQMLTFEMVPVRKPIPVSTISTPITRSTVSR